MENSLSVCMLVREDIIYENLNIRINMENRATLQHLVFNVLTNTGAIGDTDCICEGKC